MIIFKNFMQLLLVSSSLLLFGCSSGSDTAITDTTETTETVSFGLFNAPVVKGLQYTTDTQSGVSDSNGQFSYESGEIIRFYIGSIFVGETYAKEVITPLDLSPDATASKASNQQKPSNINDNWAINLFNLLISLDSNGDLSDGVEISQEIIDQAASVSLQLELAPSEFITASATVAFTDKVNTSLKQPAEVSQLIVQNYSNTSSWGSMVWGTSNWNNQ